MHWSTGAWMASVPCARAWFAFGFHDDATIAFCDAHNITYEAYGTLRDVDFTNAQLLAIAATHGVSAAQVALRFITQFGGGRGHPLAVSPSASHTHSSRVYSTRR